MNKKLTTILATVAVGGVLLGTSAYAAISSSSGYDVYKQAFKNTYGVSSITPRTAVTVKDNGKLVLKVDSVSEIDKANNSMSNNVTVSSGGLQKTMEIYSQDGKTIMKSSDSDVYNVMDNSGKRIHRMDRKEEDPERFEDIENVVDAFAGSVQNFINLSENPDGTKEVSLQMSDTQVSPVINAAASLVVRNTGKGGHSGGHMGNVFDSSLQEQLPKLVDNIKVSRVEVEAKINKGNLIQEQSEIFVITGTDSSGKTHEVVVDIDTDFSNYNSTKPDKVDLSGKQVKQISNKGFRHGR